MIIIRNTIENEAVISKLKSLKAKYGKIAIWGNRDYGGGAVERICKYYG